jgi:peptide deformylase
MILPIVTTPHPILRQQATLVEPEKIINIQTFIDDMFDTLEANGGVGLAANQVGSNLNLFVISAEGQKLVFINPVVLDADSEMDKQPEGCLSLPGLILKIPRSKRIKVMFRDRSGAQQVTELGEGWSRIFLHEFDHLQGIMIDDRAGPVSLMLAKNKLAKRQKQRARQGVSA